MKKQNVQQIISVGRFVFLVKRRIYNQIINICYKQSERMKRLVSK